MKTVFALMTFLFVANASAAQKLVCTSTHSKNYRVSMSTNQSGEVSLALERFQPYALVYFNKHDFEGSRTDSGTTFDSYASKKLARNLNGKLDVSSNQGKTRHIFLTLKNNLSEWNEPMSCK